MRSLPSGDQRGAKLSVLGEVNRTGAPPDVFATHTSRWYLLSRSFTVITVNATWLPSGDSVGCDSVETLYQSASWNARLVCCAVSVDARRASATNGFSA